MLHEGVGTMRSLFWAQQVDKLLRLLVHLASFLFIYTNYNDNIAKSNPGIRRMEFMKDKDIMSAQTTYCFTENLEYLYNNRIKKNVRTYLTNQRQLYVYYQITSR